MKEYREEQQNLSSMTFINRTSLVWKYSRCYPWCTYVYENNDIIFFIKFYKEPTTHLNINDYLQFSFSNTRFGSSSKLIHHRCSTNLTQNFYFHHLPRLWNSLPAIDLTKPANTIKQKLYIEEFLQEFRDNNANTYHYLCPCSCCAGK